MGFPKGGGIQKKIKRFQSSDWTTSDPSLGSRQVVAHATEIQLLLGSPGFEQILEILGSFLAGTEPSETSGPNMTTWIPIVFSSKRQAPGIDNSMHPAWPQLPPKMHDFFVGLREP